MGLDRRLIVLVATGGFANPGNAATVFFGPSPYRGRLPTAAALVATARAQANGVVSEALACTRRVCAGTFLVLVAACGLLPTGCTTMNVPPMTIGSVESYPLNSEARGLVVAVHPVTSEAEVDATFNSDLLGKGVVPILVVIENRNPSASFVIAKDQVAVVDTSSAASTTSALPKVASSTAGGATQAAGFVAILAAPVLAVPLVVAGLKMASDAQVIQHNLADKAFYSRTVGPGEKAHGYIYFQVPKGTELAGHHHVLIEVRDSATNEPLTFDFPIE